MKSGRAHKEEIIIDGEIFRCRFDRCADGYAVTCPALPPMMAFGETIEQARAAARDELAGWMATLEDAYGRDPWRDLRGSSAEFRSV